MSSAAVYMKEGEWGKSEYSEGSGRVIHNNNGAEIETYFCGRNKAYK